MDPSRRTECLRGTRADILNFIVNWVSDPTHTQNILWLHGLAGSGKSTIATTIANRLRECSQLGAFLFFDRDVAERSDPALVIRTLAYQLGSFHRPIGELVSAAIENTPTILLSPIQFQFERLLVTPLDNISPPATPHIVFVLDALDECSTAEGREALVDVLAENFPRLPSIFRTIVTSRADSDILYAFESQPHIYSLELDLTSTVTSHDISSYFRHHMSLIRKKKRYLGVDWPGEDNIHNLTKLASGLFVWASTALKFIDGHDPRKRLNIILQGTTTSGAESALDSLYRTALESVGLWDDEDFVEDFRAVVGMVLVLRNPLSSVAIDLLQGTSADRPSLSTFAQLGCLVSSTPTIRIIHPSFADFLSTQSRCGREKWFFRKAPHNSTLAVHCLHHLDNVLRQNICNMTLSVDLQNETLPEEVAYACTFWIEHICLIEDGFRSIAERLYIFLNRHLLHWFEAMSILSRARDVIASLNNLSFWIRVSSSSFCSIPISQLKSSETEALF